MTYWIYNMGLAVPVPTQQLLADRKVEALARSRKSPAPKGTDDHETEALPELIDADRTVIKRRQGAAYRQPEQQRKAVWQAGQIMSSPVLTLSADMSFKAAWAIFMEKRFRHFVVTDKARKLVGILSDRDMLRQASGKNSKTTTVADVMKSSVLTASATTAIQEVCQVMFSQHIGAVPIIDEQGALSGIVTRSDILRSMIKHGPLELWV
jgi:CBS domain-containing protein